MLLASCLGWAECSHVSFSNDIVIVSNNYRELRGLPGTVNRHTAVVGAHSNAPKNNVVSVHLSDAQHKAAQFNEGPKRHEISLHTRTESCLSVFSGVI